MVGQFFMINAINIARAAIRKADRGLPLDAPVEITVGSHDTTQSGRLLFVSVSNPAGLVREISVDDTKIAELLAKDDPVDVNALIDELADEIRAATREILALTHMHDGEE